MPYLDVAVAVDAPYFLLYFDDAKFFYLKKTFSAHTF
jgi:hypothetical protein